MMRIFALAAAVFFLSAPAQAQETALVPQPLDAAEVQAIMTHAVNDFIQPGYRQFERSAEAMARSMTDYCAAPTQDKRTAVDTAFQALLADWSRIEIVRVGPALEQNRFERVLYYPDRKGIGLRQVQSLLAEKDESATTPEGLTGKSVAVQGLGALEFVLYGSNAEAMQDDAQSYRCRYGAAVAGNIHNVAAELAAAWAAPDGIASIWTKPGPDNPQYRSKEEAVTALLGVLVHGTEAVRDQRIEAFYRGPDRKAFARQALFWRSGNTFTMIAGNIDGLRQLFDRSTIASLLGADPYGTADSIHFLLNTMESTALSIDPDVEKALNNPKERQKLNYLLIAGRDLIGRFNDELGGAVGLAAGFSFQDGD